MYKLFTTLIIAIGLLSCSSDNLPYSYLSGQEVEAEIIEFKYTASADTLVLKQTFQAQEMYIVWGDEASPEEVVFRGKKDSIDAIKAITHNFPEMGVYDVKIKALQLRGIVLDSINKQQIAEVKLTKTTNLLRFTCDSQNITELDFSECSKIERLVLLNNLLLDGAALDKIFESLPQVFIIDPEVNKDKFIIVLNGNKGDRDCNRSIAVSKGWTFKDSL